MNPPASGSARASSLLTVLAFGLLVAWALVVWIDAVPIGHAHTGDTDNLVLGARAATECVRQGVFSECGLVEGTLHTAVAPYPLLQYLPASVLIGAGLSDSDVVDGLSKLSFFAFVGSLVFAWLALRSRGRGIQSLGVLAIFASTATYQATSGFGEMLSAAFVLLCIAVCIHRRPVLILVAATLATTGKETLAPFVLLLGILAGRGEDDGLFPPARVLGPLVGGVAAGVVAGVAFNLFRFGVPQNALYLSPYFRTPGTRLRLSYFAGLWLSPSGGLAWYWPVATVVFLAGALATVQYLRRGFHEPRSYLPTLFSLGATVAFTAGLALWWSPFGWTGYGPRLAVPLMPGLAVLVLYLAGSAIRRQVRPIARTRIGAVALVVSLAVVGWPQYAAPWSYGSAIDNLLAPDPACEAGPTIEADPEGYHRCQQSIIWRLESLPIAAAATAGDRTADFARLLALVAAGALAAQFTLACRVDDAPASASLNRRQGEGK